MLDRIKTLYFSGAHFARVAIGTIAPFTTALAALIATTPTLRTALAGLYHDYVASSTFWAFVLVLAGYSLCAYFIGAIANIVGNLLHRLWEKIPGIGRKSSYVYWYGQNREEIDELYRGLFPQKRTLLTAGAAMPPTDQVNTLKEYLRPTNPLGFASTSRQFMKVDIVRCTLVYALGLMILFGLEAYQRNSLQAWAGIGVCVFFVWIALTELPRRVRKVVRTEYQFIKATMRLKEDLDSGLSPGD